MSRTSPSSTDPVPEYKFGRSTLSVLQPQSIETWVNVWRRAKAFTHIQFVKKGDRWKTFISDRRRRYLTQADVSCIVGSDWKRETFSLCIGLLSAVEQIGGTLYILGGDERLLSVVNQNIRQTFPKLRIIGRFRGSLDEQLEASVLTAVRKSAPDLLFLGSRMKEGNKWLHERRGELPPCLAFWSEEVFLRISGTAQRR